MAQISFIKKLTGCWSLLFVRKLIRFINGLVLLLFFFKRASIVESLGYRIYFPAISLIYSLIVTVIRLEIYKFKGIS